MVKSLARLRHGTQPDSYSRTCICTGICSFTTPPPLPSTGMRVLMEIINRMLRFRCQWSTRAFEPITNRFGILHLSHSFSLHIRIRTVFIVDSCCELCLVFTSLDFKLGKIASHLTPLDVYRYNGEWVEALSKLTYLCSEHTHIHIHLSHLFATFNYNTASIHIIYIV